MRPSFPRFLLTVSAVAAYAASARAEDVVAASRIAGVTVYEDRALVERTSTVTVGAGTTRLVFAGLPAGFDANSLRARSAEVKVLGVDTELVHLAHEALPAAEAARKEWDRTRRESSAAAMDLADAKDSWERLKSIRATAAARAGEALGGASAFDPKTVANMLDLVDEQGAKARRRIVAAQAADEAARAAEDAAKRTYEQLAANAQREETRVVVTVSAAAAGEAKVSVTYMMGNAGWSPVYDVRVSEDFAATALEMNAVVTQRTGEDWSDVPLELTTAQPSTGAAPPEPSPWTIDLMNEDRGPTQDAAAPRARRAVAHEAKLADAEAGFVAPIRRSGVVVAFRSALPANVASDGQPSRVAIGRFDLASEIRWTAFPRATDKVYVTAKMKNTVGSALPGGEARVFVGPDFVGSFALADWAQEKEIDAGLGVDREVEVARETLKHERSTTGVFSKDTVYERSFRITLKNHRARAIDVRLLDQTPVSHDEDLKVELTESSLALAKLPDREAETNKARGILEWRFPMAANAEFDLRFGFKVDHPKGRIVIGMDD